MRNITIKVIPDSKQRYERLATTGSTSAGPSSQDFEIEELATRGIGVDP